MLHMNRQMDSLGLTTIGAFQAKSTSEICY